MLLGADGPREAPIPYIQASFSPPTQHIICADCLRIADESTSRVIEWYSVVDPSSNHVAARGKREPTTGTWLLESAEFVAWRNAPNSFLWLCGIPGCGKTVLRYLIGVYDPIGQVYLTCYQLHDHRRGSS